jgi:hypothetical protein
VKTIVLIKPMRAASRDARSAESPAKTLAQKKIRAKRSASMPNRRWTQ